MSSAGPTPPGKPQARALNCPGCGAALTLRSFNNAVTIVCESCHSILDAKDPNLQILQRFKVATDEVRPLIPLGTRGQLLLHQDWTYWKEAVLHDLARVHPDVRKCVSRIDVMRFGHAMARPKPGAIFSPERRKLAALDGRLLFANSDLTGFSIFEEAQYRGVGAAEKALRLLGGRS